MKLSEPGWHLPYMTSGERVLWQTEPEKHRLTFLPIALLSIGLTLAFCVPAGLALYRLLMQHGSPNIPSAMMAAAGGVWLALAACQALLPWLLRQIGRQHPEYVLTDKRILRNRNGMVDSLLLRQMPEPTLLLEKDGTYTLAFWPGASRNPEKDSGRANLGSMLGFSIDHVQHGEQLCVAMREAHAPQAQPRPLMETPYIPIAADEVLLWQGKPARRRGLHGLFSGRYVSGVSDRWIFWVWGLVISLGFSSMVLLEVGWQWDMWPMYVLLLTILLTCILMLTMPFRRHTRCHRGIEYVLTNHRLLRRINGYVSELLLVREANTPVYLAQGRDGIATLMLCGLPRSGTQRGVSDSSTIMEGFQLKNILDAAMVADLVATVQQKHQYTK